MYVHTCTIVYNIEMHIFIDSVNFIDMKINTKNIVFIPCGTMCRRELGPLITHTDKNIFRCVRTHTHALTFLLYCCWNEREESNYSSTSTSATTSPPAAPPAAPPTPTTKKQQNQQKITTRSTATAATNNHYQRHIWIEDILSA